MIRVLILIVALSSCSPVYVIKSSFSELSILWRRIPISEVLKKDNLDSSTREKLLTIIEARNYAIKIGLDPGGSFTEYSHVDGEYLSYLLTAVEKYSFTPKLWWYPIVGTVPYKGFFTKKEAVEAGAELSSEYEINVRGVTAYSTLGWFDDPVLSLQLRSSKEELVQTVLHESVHTTFWIPKHVKFNESVAQYISIIERANFYENSESSVTLRNKHLQLGSIYEDLYDKVASLYHLFKEGKLTKIELDLERAKAFLNTSIRVKELDESFITIEKPNNAALLDLALYMSDYGAISEAFAHCGSTEKFVKLIKKRTKELGEAVTPAELLNKFAKEECLL